MLPNSLHALSNPSKLYVHNGPLTSSVIIYWSSAPLLEENRPSTAVLRNFSQLLRVYIIQDMDKRGCVKASTLDFAKA